MQYDNKVRTFPLWEVRLYRAEYSYLRFAITIPSRRDEYKKKVVNACATATSGTTTVDCYANSRFRDESLILYVFSAHASKRTARSRARPRPRNLTEYAKLSNWIRL